MTRTDLASRVGISAQAIAALENGVSKQPSFVVGILLSRVLRVWPAALAGLEPPSIVRFETDDEKFRFGIVIDYRDARSTDVSEIMEWTRQLSEALGAIPGIKMRSVDTADWNVPSVITAEPVERIPPVSAELTKTIANLDRRLGAIEKDLRRALSAKKSKSPRR
jgi:DNA-binding XRE family transcriptional regulator